ncbi:hypothetical protein J1792_08125 [Streptomyces triculaminicus]|uniref:Heparin binding hemagglutinin HbhA n=2 Tax=Streptomyces TaxID=1883 RepID=A0A939FMX6_9ACTN|nr:MULTISPECIES: hypothetical protein [Streptomyces]MBO0652750.1 hypothetical protein [Streptomyces triculaminicus]QSY51687.1 hypothetical protein J3S04_12920 [Streptomyces griseocarneus]
MAITQDIRKAATDTAYAAAGAADLTAEKIGQLVVEAPERIEKLRNTDPKALGDRFTQRAKQVQTQVTTKAGEIAGTLDADAKKLGQAAQDLTLQAVGQAVALAAQAGEKFEELAERGREAVKTWRGEAAEELSEIAVAVEPDSDEQAARDKQAKDEQAKDAPAAKQEPAAEGDADAKPAGRKTPARKPAAAAKKADAKTGE